MYFELIDSLNQSKSGSNHFFNYNETGKIITEIKKNKYSLKDKSYLNWFITKLIGCLCINLIAKSKTKPPNINRRKQMKQIKVDSMASRSSKAKPAKSGARITSDNKTLFRQNSTLLVGYKSDNRLPSYCMIQLVFTRGFASDIIPRENITEIKKYS